MFNKLSGWGAGSASGADQESSAPSQEVPVSQEADQLAQSEIQTTPTKHMMESSGKHHKHRHHHNELDGTQDEGIQAQEGRVVKERHLVQGAEQSMHYLDGIPQETTPATYSSTPIYSPQTISTPIYSPQTISTPIYSPQDTTSSLQETTPSPRAERTLAVYEPRSEAAQAPASSATTLVTVKSISAEERERQIHEENVRRAQLQEEQMKVEAMTFMEMQKRNTIAFMQKEEAKAQAKYEKEITNAAYVEAKVQKKAADMLAEAAAVRKRSEIRAQQKLEMRRAKAKTLAEENLATTKVRSTAIQKGEVRADLAPSFVKKFSKKLRM